MAAQAPPSEDTLAALGLRGAALDRLGAGLINTSWLAALPGGERRVLQALNPIFPAAINRDIDVVTRHLAARGLMTPRLIALPGGALWLEAEGAVWRMLSYVPGETRERVRDERHAREAGALLARFHAALADLDHDFANARLGVHDLDRHLAALREALAAHRRHPGYAAVEPVAAAVLALAERLPALPRCPDRNVHGDPKISNVVFDAATGAALCLIDLDTLARMPLAIELGDALRSWCNPAGEDSAEAALSMPLYRAAVTGYARHARGFAAEAEWRAFPAATLRIAVELAARFAADALEERYFAWDPRRYASAGAHNRARAFAQLALARDVAGRLPALEAETARAFSA